jgi:hypothetical protein
MVRNQNIDISNFEQEMNTFKDKFSYNYNLASKKFRAAIKEIDNSIKHLQKIKENLQLAIKNYRECGHLIVFDNSLQSRRLYDEITSRIKCSYILSNASKEELEMYKKLGFESSVLDNCLAQYVDE